MVFTLQCVSCDQVHMVVNRQSTKPRGYAFVEFDHERDMHGEFCTVFQSLCGVSYHAGKT